MPFRQGFSRIFLSMPELLSRAFAVCRRRAVPGCALLGLVLALPAAAHDFWIAPSTFRPAPGQKVAVHLRVGDAFPGDPVPRMSQRIERFALVGPGGSTDVSGVDGTDPAGFVTVAAPGRAWVVYDSNHASITLAGDKFEQHLAEQGLEKVSELRRKRGQTAAPAREIYSRSVKALLAVGPVPGKNGAGSGYDRRLGLPLELVPEADPYGPLGQGLPVRLLYLGKPLAGARFEARQPGRAETIVGRTDAAGRFVLRLPAAGFWLVKAVHMVAAPEDGGADWESFWASLTFELPAGRS